MLLYEDWGKTPGSAPDEDEYLLCVKPDRLYQVLVLTLCQSLAAVDGCMIPSFAVFTLEIFWILVTRVASAVAAEALIWLRWSLSHFPGVDEHTSRPGIILPACVIGDMTATMVGRL